MTILDLLSNTVEGVVQVTVNVEKLPIVAAIAPQNGLETIDNIAEGVSKIGDANPPVKEG
jgi:hypothetical protein